MIFQETWDKYCNIVGGTGNRADYCKVLYDYADSLSANSVILEIGTMSGGSAVCFASALENRNCHIYTIDPAFLSNEELKKQHNRVVINDVLSNQVDSTYNNVRNWIDSTPFKDNITLIAGFSEDVYKDWDKGAIIDMIYIDGCHTYEAVLKDMEWVNYLKPKGLLVMDDWIQPVEQAMKEWNEKHNNILVDTQSTHTRWPLSFRKS